MTTREAAGWERIHGPIRVGRRRARSPARVALGLLTLAALACGERRRTAEPPPTEASRAAPTARAAATARPAGATLTPTEQVGKLIFFDSTLSVNRNQSCAACHAAAWGFKGPDPEINAHGGVYEGSIPSRFGNRAPPTSAYATLSPVFRAPAGGLPTGGSFWDGRATGRQLGSAAAEQARGPFLNPKEMALTDLACVVYRVSTAEYAPRYRAVWGNDIASVRFPATTDRLCAIEGDSVPLTQQDRAKAVAEFDRIARSVAAFEGSAEMSPFDSKFDAFRKGQAQLTAQETLGMNLFMGSARCATCHTISGDRPAFTDQTYRNVGTPANPENPVYRENPRFVDLGLGGPGGAAPGQKHYGLMKVPTLRNVAAVGQPGALKSYMHNGALKTLKEVVHFYNTRDVLPACRARAPRADWGRTCWPAAEVPATMDRAAVGRLGLTAAQEDAIVAFLGTLSDGWRR
ncbi:MAG TPA: cytochrome c peroxidase [Gemmatimonadales bacterium]|nr:cytochrome c peroxidase [Gemmatimonadales bacterium]